MTHVRPSHQHPVALQQDYVRRRFTNGRLCLQAVLSFHGRDTMDPLGRARFVASQGRLAEAVSIVNDFLARMTGEVPYDYYLGCIMWRAEWLWDLGDTGEAAWSMAEAIAGRTIQGFDEATAEVCVTNAKQWNSAGVLIFICAHLKHELYFT